MPIAKRNAPAPTPEVEAEVAPEVEAKPAEGAKYMNTGTRHGCYTIAAPDGTRFTPNDEVRYPEDAWSKAQVKAGILVKL